MLEETENSAGYNRPFVVSSAAKNPPSFGTRRLFNLGAPWEESFERPDEPACHFERGKNGLWSF
jgi:hypothetical protein